LKIEKICIVGGGSAGWMTAAALIKFFPEKDITLIESPNTPPIGVGESTYEGIRFFCELLGINNDDFFSYTDASIKIGICFSKFYKEDCEDTFIYPFGPAFIEGTYWGLEDWLIKKSIYPETPNSQYAESYFPQAQLAKYGRFSENKNGEFERFRPNLDTALHFDAIKFGKWLKNNFCLPKNVKNIEKEIIDIELNTEGISYLILDDGQKIYADLFVDCTGFKSLLIGKTLKEKFVSYEHILPNNRAWATRIPYLDKEKELKPVTTCTALKNGWTWDIPLWSRLGSGYVYSDKYIDKEKALLEFKQYLMSENMTVPRSYDEVESLEFLDISMRVGIHERTWVKNVVAIGLSAGFIEPLESNGLFTVHEFLYQLIRSMLREEVTGWDIEIYNKKTQEIYDNFVNFIRIHYSLSVRKDSNYWLDNMNRSNYLDKDNLLSKNLDHIEFLSTAKTQSFKVPNYGGIPWISTGMNYPILDTVSIKHGELKNGMNYKNDLDLYFRELDNKISIWKENALNSPTLYEYLKNKYH
jgi:tryptophan halogenase